MIKNYKFLIFAVKFTVLAAAVNHYFKLTVKARKDCTAEPSYNYRFGPVSYIKKGTGAPLLLLHSPHMGGSKSEWEVLLGSFSRNYCVYAPDLPGFGSSAQLEISYSSYLYASFINSFIEDVIGEPAIVIAVGKAADFSVCASSFNSKNFKKLILISPTGFSEVPAPCPYRSLMKKLIEVPLYGTFLYNIIRLCFIFKNFLARLCPGVNFADAKTQISISDQASKFAVSALYSGELNLDIRAAAKKSTIPTLITLGAEDDIHGIPCEVETLMFRDSGTLPHLVRENRQFIREVLSWLKK